MPRTLLMASDPGGIPGIAGEFFILGGTKLAVTGAALAQHQAAARIPGHFCFLGGQFNGSVSDGQNLQFVKDGIPGQTANFVPGWFQTSNQDVVSATALWYIGIADGLSSTDFSVARTVFSADANIH